MKQVLRELAYHLSLANGAGVDLGKCLARLELTHGLGLRTQIHVIMKVHQHHDREEKQQIVGKLGILGYHDSFMDCAVRPSRMRHVHARQRSVPLC